MKRKTLRILAAGDFHGNKEISKKLSEKARKEKVDLVILTGDIFGGGNPDETILEPFNKQKVLFVPGNWDSKEETEILARNAKNIDKRYTIYNEWGIMGIGSMDWKLELEHKDFYELKEATRHMKPQNKILVSHLHAAGSKAEFSGVKGDEIIRKAIDEFKPTILINSHIHEAEGIEDCIGETNIFQVGRKGTIIEV